ncbi:MAG: DUF4340 domain-containing protein [Planctomycetota bacterium]
MHLRTILVLLAVVGGLVVILKLQEQEKVEATRPEEALFPDFDAEAVYRMEVHHLERGIEVVLERDAQGRWSLTEPVPYPAERGMVRTLLELLGRTRGIPIDGSNPELLGLDRPRLVVRFAAEPTVEGGSPRTGLLEVGADDVDGVRCFARVDRDRPDTRVLRASRRLATSLDLNPNDYRDRRATWLSSSNVVSFRRSGALPLAEGEEPTDLAFDALLGPGGWTSQSPVPGTLDPVQLGFLVRGAAELRIDGFRDDAPQDLADYGLDPPRLRVELEDSRGGRVALRFGCFEQEPVTVEGAHRWFACREGYPFVWTVDFRTVGLLSAPRHELYDTLLVRALREDIVGVELARARLTRDGEAWTVASLADGASYPADLGAVEDVLAKLEFARAGAFDEAGTPLPEGAGALAVVLRDGNRLGGELALGAADAPEGGARFRRFGDGLVGAVDADVVELFATPVAALRSNAIQRLDELQLQAVQLRGGSSEARFERPPDDPVWHPADAAAGEEVDPAFYPVLERLLFLDAVAWLDGEGEALTDPVTVELHGTFGVRTFELGGGADGRAECRTAGSRAEVAVELIDGLRALLQ